MDAAKKGNIVRDVKIGNTRIKICDDSCRNATPEEVQAILDSVADRVFKELVLEEERKS